MNQTIEKIIEDWQNNLITKQSAQEALITFIENGDDTLTRVEGLRNLGKIGLTEEHFKLIEHLIISDSNKDVRAQSILLLDNFFLQKALDPLKWALQFESDYKCLFFIVEALVRINSDKARQVLIEELNRIKKARYIDNTKDYSNKGFKKSIKSLKIKELTIQELADIILNHIAISAIIAKFFLVFFKWEKGKIVSLDLSELGWNPNIWRQRYADKIRNLLDIPGLSYLNSLKILDLSHNLIENIEALKVLKELEHLNLRMNKIESEENIEFFKLLPNLKYLDITANKIKYKINPSDFEGVKITIDRGYSRI